MAVLYSPCNQRATRAYVKAILLHTSSGCSTVSQQDNRKFLQELLAQSATPQPVMKRRIFHERLSIVGRFAFQLLGIVGTVVTIVTVLSVQEVRDALKLDRPHKAIQVKITTDQFFSVNG